jgi:hypothetical protein
MITIGELMFSARDLRSSIASRRTAMLLCQFFPGFNPLACYSLLFGQDFTRKPHAESCNGEEHRHRLENVEYPLMVKGIPMETETKFDKPIGGSNLTAKIC